MRAQCCSPACSDIKRCRRRRILAAAQPCRSPAAAACGRSVQLAGHEGAGARHPATARGGASAVAVVHALLAPISPPPAPCECPSAMATSTAAAAGRRQGATTARGAQRRPSRKGRGLGRHTKALPPKHASPYSGRAALGPAAAVVGAGGLHRPICCTLAVRPRTSGMVAVNQVKALKNAHAYTAGSRGHAPWMLHLPHV